MMRRSSLFLILCLLALPMSAFAEGGGAGQAVSETKRVVTIGAPTTEIVFALGGGGLVVGTDTTSGYPAETAALPKIGYMRSLSAEGILSLSPDLVIAPVTAGPPAVLGQLEQAGVRILRLPEDPTPEGLVVKVRRVAEALGRPRDGEDLALRLERELAGVRQAVTALGTGPRVLFLLLGHGNPMASGTGTSADGMIRLAGGSNVVEGYEGYRPFSAEAALALDPDVIMVDQAAIERLGGVAGVAAHPLVKLSRAGQAGRIVSVDGAQLLGFGPRTPAAARDLAAALFPGRLEMQRKVEAGQ